MSPIGVTTITTYKTNSDTITTGRTTETSATYADEIGGAGLATTRAMTEMLALTGATVCP